MRRLPLDQQSSAFVERQRALGTKLSADARRAARRICKSPCLHLAKHKVLSSLHNHWDGLTVFSMAA